MLHYENDVPEGWVTTVLDELATFGGGKTPSMDHKEYWNNGKYLWITSKDMKFAHITDSILKISDIALEEMTTYGKGTLLMVTRSGILRHTLPIAILDVQATVNQDIKTISCYVHEVHKYLYYAIKAQEAHILENYHKDGTTVDSIDLDRFKKLSIHLPPLSEQQRIVEEIEHWFTLIDTIEQGKVDLQTTIKQAKSKILDLAIHGKLVQQNPNDEPASELLKRINPKAQIPCDNEHSRKLPYNWSCVSHNSIIELSGGSQPPKRKFISKPTKGYIRLFQIRDYGKNPLPVYIPNVDAVKQTHKGDILLARYGGSLGKVFIAENGAYNVAMTKVIFKQPQLIDKMFAFFYYHSRVYQDKLKEISRTAQAGFNSGDFEDLYFPLPPLAEQKRIVRKIEDLFTLINIIEMELAE